MKTWIAVLLSLLLSTAWVSAGESPIFAKTVPIFKITSHEKGYKVVYVTEHGDFKVAYLPIEWFYQVGDYRNADGFVKCEMYKGAGAAYPYMQIFWKDGKFHHVRLFVMANYNDRTWGTVNLAENLSGKFDPAKVPDFTF